MLLAGNSAALGFAIDRLRRAAIIHLPPAEMRLQPSLKKRFQLKLRQAHLGSVVLRDLRAIRRPRGRNVIPRLMGKLDGCVAPDGHHVDRFFKVTYVCSSEGYV